MEVSLTDLVSVVQRDNLGEPHAVLVGGERYVPTRFATGDSPPNEVRDAVEVVQRARFEYYGWVTSAADSYAVLVAAIGRAGVVLTRTGDRVTLCGADPDRLAESLVLWLPEVPAGRGAAMSVRAAAYNQAGDGVLQRAGSARSLEARRLEALLSAPRLGGAQLYTARRDHTGTRRRSRESIIVLDVDHLGRWLVYTTSGGGERHVNAVPGTPRMLSTKLAELNRSPTG